MAIITIFLSALLAAFRTIRVSPIQGIRQAKSVKISSKKVKNSWIVRKFFGFEGVLAEKAIKRSKGKYRATVISITISVILSIGVSSFSHFFQQVTTMATQTTAYNINAFIYDENLSQEKNNELLQIAKNTTKDTISTTSLLIGYRIDSNTMNQLINPGAKEYFKNVSEQPISFIAVSNEELKQIAAESNIDYNTLSDKDNLNGILLNTTNNSRMNGKFVNTEPYKITNQNNYLNVSLDGSNNIKLNIVGTSSKIPPAYSVTNDTTTPTFYCIRRSFLFTS